MDFMPERNAGLGSGFFIRFDSPYRFWDDLSLKSWFLMMIMVSLLLYIES